LPLAERNSLAERSLRQIHKNFDMDDVTRKATPNKLISTKDHEARFDDNASLAA
jgi:hypothetical protein